MTVASGLKPSPQLLKKKPNSKVCKVQSQNARSYEKPFSFTAENIISQLQRTYTPGRLRLLRNFRPTALPETMQVWYKTSLCCNALNGLWLLMLAQPHWQPLRGLDMEEGLDYAPARLRLLQDIRERHLREA